MNVVEQAVAAAPYAQRAFSAVGGVKGFAGRLIGFGADEMDVGVPGWAWLIIGAGLGATAMWFAKDRVQEVMSKRFT